MKTPFPWAGRCRALDVHSSRFGSNKLNRSHVSPIQIFGMACGAGCRGWLPWLALVVTASYFVVAPIFPLLMRLIPGMPPPTEQSRDPEHD